jgi:small subunit ribosomal protein S16
MSRVGRFLELVGTYDQIKNPAEIRLKVERLDHWVSVGAQPTDTVASLVRRFRRENLAATAAD